MPASEGAMGEVVGALQVFAEAGGGPAGAAARAGAVAGGGVGAAAGARLAGTRFELKDTEDEVDAAQEVMELCATLKVSIGLNGAREMSALLPLQEIKGLLPFTRCTVLHLLLLSVLEACLYSFPTVNL